MCKYKFILFQTLSFLDLTLEAYRPESDWKSPENPFSCLASAWIANGNSRAHISRISHPEKCYSPSRFILHLKWQRRTLGKRKLSQTDFSFLSSCLEGRVGGLVIQWHVHLPLCKILTHLPLKIFPGVSASCVDSIAAASFILGGDGNSIEFSHFQTNEFIEE